MAVQVVQEVHQLRESAAILGLDTPRRVLDALLPSRGFVALSLALGLESLAEALALDWFDVDEPPAIIELGDAHQTAYPLRK